MPIAAIVGMAALLVIVIILPFVIVSIAYPYLALRLRDSREEKRDPQLGVKAAYYMLLSAALLLLLLGATMFAIDLMDGAFDKAKRQQAQQQQQGVFGAPRGQQPDPLMNPSQRTALGLMVSGVLFALTFMLILKMSTNDAEYPAAKRVFVGGRLAFAGVVVMVALTVLIVLFFQKEVPDKTPYEVLTAILMVWVPALAVHMVLMRYYGGQPYHIERGTSAASRRRNDGEFFDDD